MQVFFQSLAYRARLAWPLDVKKMEITETTGKRFELAMELLGEGNSVTFEDVSFRIISPTTLLIQLESSWQLDRITHESAIKDIESAHSTMKYLCNESSRFNELVSGKEIETVLFLGYGMGEVEICTEKDSNIEWAKGISIEKNI